MEKSPLHAELDRIVQERKLHGIETTVAALGPLLEQHPDDARLLLEVADAFDAAGEPVLARIYYRRALDNGLTGDLRRRCLLEYAHTLNAMGMTDESAEVISEARAEFPRSIAVGAFAALSLQAQGHRDAAIGSLLMLLLDHDEESELTRYASELRGEAEYMISVDLATEP